MLQIWNHHDHTEIITDKKSFENLEGDEVSLTLSNELLAVMLIKAVKGEHLLYDSEEIKKYNVQTRREPVR